MKAIGRSLRLLFALGFAFVTACPAVSPQGAGGGGGVATMVCDQFIYLCTCECSDGEVDPNVQAGPTPESCAALVGGACGDAGADGGDAGSSPVYLGCTVNGFQNAC